MKNRAIPTIPAQVLAREIGTMHAPPTSAFSYQILTPVANMLALTWVPVGTQTASGRLGDYRVVNGTDLTARAGYSLHPGDQTPNPSPANVWNSVIIAVDEEVVVPFGEDFPSTNDGEIGNTSSMLKARIVVSLGNARTKTVDFDIGAGMEFGVKGFAVLGISALIPDPASIVTSPEDIPTPTPSLATIITTAVYCGTNPRYRCPLTYTQSLLLVEGTGVMPVVPAAREVEFFFDPAAGDPSTTTVEFIYLYDSPIGPSVVAPIAQFVTLGTVVISPLAASSGKVIIPGDANAMLITTGGGSQVVTIVQHLHL